MRGDELKAQYFREAEESLLFDGLDVSADEFYRATKARVVAGEIDAAEMMRLIAAKSTPGS